MAAHHPPWFPFWRDTWESYLGALPGGQFKVALAVFTVAANDRPRDGLRPGQAIVTTRSLGKLARVSHQTVLRALARMASEGTITAEPSGSRTLITLCKYSSRRLGAASTRTSSRVDVDQECVDVDQDERVDTDHCVDTDQQRVDTDQKLIRNVRAEIERERSDLGQGKVVTDVEVRRHGPVVAAPLPTPEQLAARDLARAQRWHAEGERRRSALVAELGLPHSTRPVPLIANRAYLEASGVLAAVESYTDDQLEHCLAVREAQARTERRLQRWQPWHPKAIAWALQRDLAEVGGDTGGEPPASAPRRRLRI